MNKHTIKFKWILMYDIYRAILNIDIMKHEINFGAFKKFQSNLTFVVLSIH